MPNEIKPEVEYRVRKVERYVVTRYTNPLANAENAVGGGAVEERGQYDNPDVAHEVAYALCKREHEGRGWHPGDMRIIYPQKEIAAVSL